MRLGDMVYYITKYTGIKWLVHLVVVRWLGYESCGCEKRRDDWNNIKISRNGRHNTDE